MEQFINQTIDTTQLPKFEEVNFSKLHPSYWKVMLINLLLIFAIIAIAMGLFIYTMDEKIEYLLEIGIAVGVALLLILFFTRISFNKRAFAFRNHDVLYRHGIIATNTIVIPYNRIQHVALHEGWLSRIFGLAAVEIFTAGGSSSDIEIHGIEKEQAENIKQLLMVKIQKEL